MGSEGTSGSYGLSAGLAFGCAALLALAPAALASTYRPNKTGDSPSGGLTLREAIAKANNHPGFDAVVLRAGTTYKLSIPGIDDTNAAGDLDIADIGGSGLTIKSSSNSRATVDAQGIDRVFDVDTNAKFIRLRIRGGNSLGGGDGGGISGGGGKISLSFSRVVGNFTTGDAGGIDPGSGRLSVSRSVISGNRANDEGGGIQAGDLQGSTSISKSTIKNNVADADLSGGGGGGGIFNRRSMSIKSSTISGNRTSNSGNAGGGILNSDGTLNLVNSTIANNLATAANGDGGGLSNGGAGAAVSMNAVTIARNSAGDEGGGFDTDGGSLIVRNSLIALNTATSSPDCNDASAPVTSFGQNLVGNNAFCTSFSATSGDFVNLSSSKIGIGQLRNNGGPTRTIALKSGSKAINNAGSDAPDRDQRGVKRQNKDIGAFERR